MKVSETSDGRYIGYDCLEIMSFPPAQNISEDKKEAVGVLSDMFCSFLGELCSFGKGRDMCAEIVWITEEARSQTFQSYVRIFFLIRSIAKAKETVERELSHMKNSMASLLKTDNFSWAEDEGRLNDLLSAVSTENAKAVVKSEQITGNMYSPYPYYSCSVLPDGNQDNFEFIISSLSQTSGACISFQVFPSFFSREELFFLNEQAAEMQRLSEGIFARGQIIRDSSASEPQRVLKYYLTNGINSVFRYNICVFGKSEDAIALSSRVVSLLQAGREKNALSDCIILDISREKINLCKHLYFYPWNLNNRLVYSYRNGNAINVYRNIKTLMRLPYIMTDKEVLSFFRLPLYEKKMAALKENSSGVSLEQFDDRVVKQDNVRFGRLASDESVIIGCPEKDFTKHMLIVGTPGSGKTTFSINLLLQLAKRGIPFLSVEPTKTEYRAMIDALPDLQIFTPGNNDVAPFIINPFVPPEGIRIEQYIPSLVNAFEAAFSMPSPLDVLFLNAVRSCYSEHGWKDYSMQGDKDVKAFGLREFIVCFRKIIRASNYSAEVKGNLESGGFFRLVNLIEQNRNIYDTVNSVPISDILSKPTVIELNAIDNAEQKALIMALLLINICIYTKNHSPGDGKLKNIFLLDEAHVLLANGGSREKEKADSSGTTIRAIQDMIAEIRAYGTGIIIADQSPVRVGREIVAMTDIKASFRIVQSSEKEIIADTTNMDESEKKRLSMLHPGEAFVFYSALEKAQQVITEDIRDKENIRLVVSNDEIKDRMTYWNARKKLLRPYLECDFCKGCREDCDFRLRSQADYYALKLYEKNKNLLKDKGTVVSYIRRFPEMMGGVLPEMDESAKERIVDCTRIKFIKKMEMDFGWSFTENEIRTCFKEEKNV